MDQQRDLEQEEMLGDIIRDVRDVFSFLNNNDGLEGEEAGYGDRTMDEESHDHDGSGDRMAVEDGDRDDGSGDQTESGSAVAKSGEVYILSLCWLANWCINCFGMYMY